MFRIKLGAAKVALIRAARSTRTLDCFVVLKLKSMRIVMCTQIPLSLILFFSTPVLAVQRKSGERVPRTPLIGNVRKVADKCGCYFRSADEEERSERYVFFEDAIEGAPLMNIGGRNVRLRLISSTEPPGGVRRKGERFSRRYTARGINVRMELVATSVCPGPYNPECVANSFDVTLTTTKGSRRQTIRAVGGCGC